MKREYTASEFLKQAPKGLVLRIDGSDYFYKNGKYVYGDYKTGNVIYELKGLWSKFIKDVTREEFLSYNVNKHPSLYDCIGTITHKFTLVKKPTFIRKKAK